MPRGIYKRGIIHRNPHSEETRKKISIANSGLKRTPEQVKQMSLIRLGKKYPNRKKYFKGISVFHKICLFCKKDYVANYGNHSKSRFCSNSCASKNHHDINLNNLKKVDREYQRKVASQMTGEKHPRWIKDRTQKLDRCLQKNSQEYKDCRSFVFERDNYTCQECNESGIYIESHHIIPLRIDRNKIFEINNCITLCRKCHLKTLGKEELFIEKYLCIIEKKLTKL